MFLRQSTASQEVLIGPFLDDTDGKTAETGLTIANTDCKIWKSGATTEANKNSGGATHIAAGRYYIVLDATDTDTVGMIEINIAVSGALPVQKRLYVLEEAAFDALFAASSPGPMTTLGANAPANWINLAAINDGAIGLNKIGSNAITSSVIQADAINAAKIADGTLTSAKFAAGAFDAVWSVATRTLTTVANSAGVTTLLSRITALIRTKAEDDTADSTITGAIPSAAAVASQVRTELTAELDEIGTTLAEVGKIPRAASALAAGSFTVEVVNGQVISGGQSVDMEYK